MNAPAHKVKVFTLWAGDAETCWMIAAEDEFSWLADPDRCEKLFADAKARVGSEWEFREVEIRIDLAAVQRAFWATVVEGDVAVSGTAGQEGTAE